VRDALPYVLYHHERWDGDGYPTGRRGAQIPEGARLLAVADAFDAMTSTRPYRRALPMSRALSEIERCAGTQFDPSFARAFLEAWSAGALADAAAM
jgi:HD-GYP domain-containing protein (c-di-GMP phosphodiesterase class II)